jgi:hypothetical protein
VADAERPARPETTEGYCAVIAEHRTVMGAVGESGPLVLTMVGTTGP